MTRRTRALRVAIHQYREYPDLDHPLWGEDRSSCPYYRGEGICDGGCWEEPRCITDEPIHGWPSQRRPNRPIDKVRRARTGLPAQMVAVRQARDRVDRSRLTRYRRRSHRPSTR